MELLWGIWDRYQPTDVELCSRLERPVIAALLDLFRRYETPVTWAVVGRLLDNSPGFEGLAGTRDNWYAPDIVNAIRSDPIPHEIGSHSYAHIDYSCAPPGTVAEDLARAREVHTFAGLPFESLVFPRNRVGCLNLVADAGIRIIRTHDAGLLKFCEDHLPRARPVANLVDKAVPFAPSVVWPTPLREGLVELPSSLLFLGRNGLRNAARPSLVSLKMRRGLSQAIDSGRIFHLWFHPSNFYYKTEIQLRALRNLLAEAAKLRDAGILKALTMGDASKLVNF